MRIALLADIHGNLPALTAVLADLASRGGADATYHLGDLVGYAPWPNEVVALLTERGIPGVAGNYDSTVATGAPHCGCRSENPEQERLSHLSYAWTLANVNAATRRALGALPFRIDLKPLGGHAPGPTIVLVHGTPTLNTLYWTADRSDEFCARMAGHAGMRAGDLVAFGHTHVPWTRDVQGMRFVNAGSVGRPKDGDPRAAYVLLHAHAQGVEADLVRVAYDVERAARAIEESDLPDEFAAFLRTGGRPAMARS